MDKHFNTLINKYHPTQWLLKAVERTRNRDLTDVSKRENLYATTEFLIIMSDIAIRISQNNQYAGQIPSNQDYVDFINLYINTQSTKSASIKKYGVFALALLTYEQIKYNYPQMNLLGRLFVLYGQYEEEIFEFSGLKISDILTIVLALTGEYIDEEYYFFSIDDLVFEDIDGLKKEVVEKFLGYFSIDMKNYKMKLKGLGIDKKQLFSFRLLERYPIVKLEHDQYIVPSLDNLLYSITSNLHIHLLQHYSAKKKASKYHTELGNKFEDYIELLTKEVFNSVTTAKSVVPNETLNAEFVISHKSTAIVVEVKKFSLNRDTAFQNSMDDLERLLQQHFIKAFAQIETTFKYVQDQNKIGIIVTFGGLNMQSMIHNYMREKYPKFEKENGDIVDVSYLENIIIMSVGGYESLMANTQDNIIRILEAYLSKPINERGNIVQTISSLKLNTKNPYLKKVYDEGFEKLGIEKYREDNYE